VSSTITPPLPTIRSTIHQSAFRKSYFYSFGFTGGPLGGNVNTITNVFDWKYFHPIQKRRNVIGFHASGAYTTGYGGKEVPPYSRFYMGGENDVRGFDLRSISPVAFIRRLRRCLSPFTIPPRWSSSQLYGAGANLHCYSAGGDVQTSGNVEYRIPIVGPVTAALFFDGGTDGIARPSALNLNLKVSRVSPNSFPGAT